MKPFPPPTAPAPSPRVNRRDLLRLGAAASLAASLSAFSENAAGPPPAASSRPNIVLYIADQVRWDFLAAYGHNPSACTPNLDRLFRGGTAFRHAFTNQPLCSPSRACLFTGRYATETGVWTLDKQLRHDLPTLASQLRSSGYTANFIGKWHLAAGNPTSGEGLGWVRPEDRGGFLDLWEASNVLELTSHPYQGRVWDAAGHAITWKDQYRVDFLTQRAIRFLDQPQSRPFLLCLSQLEPHHQNDVGRFIAPDGYAARFQNPFVPPDLLHLPGDWQQQLPDYYGSMEAIDQSVGSILQKLEQRNLIANTIFVFTSDHGCHFRTRNADYKRSPHDSSTRVPLVLAGPVFNVALLLDQLVSHVDLTPTLLAACGIASPSGIRGRNLLPLLSDPKARSAPETPVFIQISQSMVGRALRSAEWTYCVADTQKDPFHAEFGRNYTEYLLYNNFGDPAQLTNLIGRPEYSKISGQLRAQLLEQMKTAGEPEATIQPAPLPA